jgi:hypothetical protein
LGASRQRDSFVACRAGTAHGTNAFGRAGAPVLAKALASIQTMLAGAGPTNGNLLASDKIFILGSSSGDRKLTLLQSLTCFDGLTEDYH